MKRVLSSLLVAALLIVGGARAEDRIVFVDVQELFKSFYKTQLAQDQIRQQADDIKMEREELEEGITALKEEVEALRADSRDETLSAEVRQGKREQLEEKLVNVMAKEREMAEFEKLRREQLEKQNARMTRTLFDEIQEAIVLYAKAEGYASVIDRSAQSRRGTEVVLYTDADVDITADVLAVLNEGREGFQTDESDLNDGESEPENKE
jgi:Skp family chaperone for outer membrane proteins